MKNQITNTKNVFGLRVRTQVRAGGMFEWPSSVDKKQQCVQDKQCDKNRTEQGRKECYAYCDGAATCQLF